MQGAEGEQVVSPGQGCLDNDIMYHIDSINSLPTDCNGKNTYNNNNNNNTILTLLIHYLQILMGKTLI